MNNWEDYSVRQLQPPQELLTTYCWHPVRSRSTFFASLTDRRYVYPVVCHFRHLEPDSDRHSCVLNSEYKRKRTG